MTATSKIDETPHLKTTRINLDTIVVAVDRSPSSEKTVQAAAHVARLFDSRLLISHIFQFSDVVSDVQLENVRRNVGRLCQLAEIDNTHPVAVLRQGSVVEEIQRIINEGNADLLVLGTHGTEGLEKFVLGSTSEALFRSVYIPVLTVGPHTDPLHNGFTSILVATDLTPRSLRAMQYAAALAQEYDAVLTVLHVLDPLDGASSYVREEVVEEMRQLVPENADLWCTPVFRTETGDPAARILSVAGNCKADLIIMSVDRAPFDSHAPWTIATEVVNHANCPVLTVRSKA